METLRRSAERDGYERLGVFVSRARRERGLTQTELAAHAGVSINTVKNLEQGKISGRMPLHIAKIESVLEWAPGSAEAVVEGFSPTSTRAPFRPSAASRRAIQKFLETAACPPGVRDSLLRQLDQLP